MGQLMQGYELFSKWNSVFFIISSSNFEQSYLLAIAINVPCRQVTTTATKPIAIFSNDVVILSIGCCSRRSQRRVRKRWGDA